MIRIKFHYSQFIKTRFSYYSHEAGLRNFILVFCTADYTSIQETKQKPDRLIYGNLNHAEDCDVATDIGNHARDLNWCPNLKHFHTTPEVSTLWYSPLWYCTGSLTHKKIPNTRKRMYTRISAWISPSPRGGGWITWFFLCKPMSNIYTNYYRGALPSLIDEHV
jgi:hypothetical protein